MFEKPDVTWYLFSVCSMEASLSILQNIHAPVVNPVWINVVVAQSPVWDSVLHVVTTCFVMLSIWENGCYMGFVFRMFHGGFIVCSAKHTECCMKSGMNKCSCCIKSGLRFRTSCGNYMFCKSWCLRKRMLHGICFLYVPWRLHCLFCKTYMLLL